MALVSVDDYSLVTAHRGGDHKAFDDIVRRYTPALVAHARRRLGDPDAAEDVVQEAFLRAYRALPAFAGEYRLGPWLHRIVDNVCMDHLDRRRRDATLQERLAGRATTDDTLDVDALVARDDSARALGQLPVQQRDALVQRFVEDKSYEEIASSSGVTQQAVRARVSRARRTLRRVFELPGASAIVIGGFARRITMRGASAAEAPSPRLGLATQLAPSLSSAAPSGATLATKVVLAATAVVAIAVPATQNTGSLPPAPPAAVVERAAPPAAAPSASEVTTAVEPSPPADAALAPVAVEPTTATTVAITSSSSLSSSSIASSSSSSDAPVAIAPVSPSNSSSSSDAPPASTTSAVVEFRSDELQLTRAGPRFVVSGRATFVTADGTSIGVNVDGKILLDESDPAPSTPIDGTLSMTTDDGRTLRLQIGGSATRVPDDGSSSGVGYTIDAQYSLDGSDIVGLPHDGSLSGMVRDRGDNTGSLALEMKVSSS